MTAHSVDKHFDGKLPVVRETYDMVLHVARRFGNVAEDPKKTSIHLVARTAFVGVTTRQAKLVLTIKSPVAVKGRRVAKCEQLSANRWHFELHVNTPADIDSDFEAWLRRAYEISA